MKFTPRAIKILGTAMFVQVACLTTSAPAATLGLDARGPGSEISLTLSGLNVPQLGSFDGLGFDLTFDFTTTDGAPVNEADWKDTQTASYTDLVAKQLERDEVEADPGIPPSVKQAILQGLDEEIEQLKKKVDENWRQIAQRNMDRVTDDLSDSLRITLDTLFDPADIELLLDDDIEEELERRAPTIRNLTDEETFEEIETDPPIKIGPALERKLLKDPAFLKHKARKAKLDLGFDPGSLNDSFFDVFYEIEFFGTQAGTAGTVPLTFASGSLRLAPIPLPAGLPLLAAGLATAWVLGQVRSRRRPGPAPFRRRCI